MDNVGVRHHYVVLPLFRHHFQERHLYNAFGVNARAALNPGCAATPRPRALECSAVGAKNGPKHDKQRNIK